MNNAIVYSLHVSEKKLSLNYGFEQLKMSIQSVRMFNSTIPIKVYISPAHRVPEYTASFLGNGVEVIPFIASADVRLDHKIYALWTSHKWVSSFRALREFGFDNILYVDTDTYFQKDPEYLFNKYGNTESIYGKADISDKWTSVFDAKNGGMNDGQYLLSKHVLKYEKDILRERVEYVYKLQRKFKNHPDDEIRITGVQWVACQYGVSEYLYKIGNPLKWFDNEDVYIVHYLSSFKVLPLHVIQNFALVHYLNYNMEQFCPQAYEIFKRARQ